MSIRDRSRYQMWDRTSTYSKETYDFNAMLPYDYEEYETRHLMNPMNDGDGETCYHAFHCAGNNLIMHLRTFVPVG